MDLGFDGKTALITGASRGIGAATARLLAGEGADIVVGYGRDRDSAERSAAVVRSLGRRAWTVPMDIAEPDSVAAAARSVSEQVGAIDTAVLCAGQNIVTPMTELEPSEWAALIAVNLNGTYNTLHAFAPMINDGGSIVIVSSVAARTGAPRHAHYAAAKAGQVNLSKSAARALAPRVRVNCVAPGITRTEIGEATIASLPGDYARTKLLAQRFAEPDEIARCIAFVASPVSGFMYGATIDINGGRDLR
ncbi:MAG: SDR family NAD(P)-dependent oxidoreductase [Myxococcota bacterium]